MRLAREPGTELVLVARREERLRELAAALPAAPPTSPSISPRTTRPERVRAHLEAEPGAACTCSSTTPAPPGAATFAESGYANVQRHIELNFDAVVRLTEALLPLLRGSAPSAIVNVASTAGRVARARTGAYSASKFALIGWTDALYAEEEPARRPRRHGPARLRSTEGFPATELREKALTRLLVSKPERVAEAIHRVGPGGQAERYVPRPYALAGIAPRPRAGPRPPRARRRRRSR